MRLHRPDMGRVGADGEEGARNGRVQRLDAAVHHLGKTGEVGDVEDSMPRPTHRPRRAAGRDEFDAVTDERGGEVGTARLVADGKERAADGNDDRKSVVSGKTEPDRADHGGRVTLTKKVR